MIKVFGKIHLYKHGRSARQLQRVNDLMGEDNIIHDLESFYIAQFLMRDNKIKKGFEVKGNYLGDNLVDKIAQHDQP